MTTISEFNLRKAAESQSDRNRKREVKPEGFRSHLKVSSIREDDTKDNLLTLVTKLETEEKNASSCEETDSEENSLGIAALQPLAPVAPIASGSTMQTQSVKALSGELLALFESMASEITIMDANGVTETTITYASKEPHTSPFHNTQITVNEFRTAPKAFNIQIDTSPQALAILQKNLPNLTAAFETGKYCFKINRLDISLKKTHRLSQPTKAKKMTENDFVDNVE
jgi:hypothetical protein